MATDNALQQVALGLDQAKQTIYRIMKQYYPKIEDSKSSLVNAIVSGIAYIYSTFQVFAKLLQSELYVSTARELESLYKLIPFVGITLDQPTPMLITATTQPQDDSITDSTVPPLYIQFPDPFLDSASFNFHQTYKQYLRKVVFDFTIRFNSNSLSPLNFFVSGNSLTVSLGKQLGDNFIPPAMAATNGDYLSVEFPYVVGAVIRKGRIKFTASLQNVGVLTGASVTNDGSDVPADILLSQCSLDVGTGKLCLTVQVYASFAGNLIVGLPVNVTYNVRATYLKPAVVTGALLPASGSDFAAYGDVTPGFFDRSILFSFRHNTVTPESPLTDLVITNSAGNTTLVFFAYSGTDDNGKLRRVAIDPFTVKITGLLDSTIIFDFAKAEVLRDPYFGTIYRVKFSYPVNGFDFYAYVLDEYAGVIYVENPQMVSVNQATFKFDYTTKPSNKVFLQQFDTKVKSVSPPADFNTDNNTFVLEDDDPIMFNNFKIQITDAGYSTLQFKQVTSLVTVSGNSILAYFEVRVLAPTKVELKFGRSIDYTTIQNMLINYQTVKDISLYKSGEVLTGVVQLYYGTNGSLYSLSGKTDFPFSAVNVSSLAGASGIPTLEGLRDALTKAAYTLNINVTRINYESAIESYFLGLGYDSRIKVFDYSDFGNPSVLLNSVNGNIVYFIGLVNHYPNSDFVVVVPTELNSTPYVEGTAQYSRLEFSGQVPAALTDIGLDMIVPVGKSSNDLDILQNSIRDDSALTNIIFTEGSNNVTLGITPFSVMYAIYFKALLNPADGFTYTQAKVDVSNYLASLFKWSTLNFIRDINVSDVYRAIDSLPSVDKILFSNLSHFRNNGVDGSLVVHDITYKKFFGPYPTVPLPADIMANPLWDFSNVNTTGRGIKIHILGLGGIELSPYPNV